VRSERTRFTPPSSLDTLEVRRLAGGLEASAVLAVAFRANDTRGRPRVRRAVVKQLAGSTTREAEVYERFVTVFAPTLAPRLYAIVREADTTTLWLEAVSSTHPWPWCLASSISVVLHDLAALHASPAAAAAALPAWDYEGMLVERGHAALAQLASARHDAPGELVRGARLVARLVDELPRLRQELMRFAPFGRAALHGDVHSGNAFLRQRARRPQTILVDWGRARSGSPLEDVSSWLQSLGSWEPEALRRHDSLLASYLAARGWPERLDDGTRGAYWLAAASNVLAGALEYQLHVAMDARRTHAERHTASGLARDALRIIRRADAFCR
jgi:hypothetical protein